MSERYTQKPLFKIDDSGNLTEVAGRLIAPNKKSSHRDIAPRPYQEGNEEVPDATPTLATHHSAAKYD